jgi:NhaA family Na+:H+ antiporter
MSLFIANLAFSDPALLASSKLAILAGSVLSALGGWLILSRVAGARGHPVP